MLYIQLENDHTVYMPGDQVRGVAGWELPQPPRDAQVVLFWHTVGIGTQDIGVLETIPMDGAATHQEAFAFELPESPYSFSGTHITLQWSVELAINKGKEAQRVDIVVSPLGQPAKLPQVEDGNSLKLKFLNRNKQQENTES